MPEVKINKSNVSSGMTYKCFLLNVRSHRDYVCLEVDSCPSGLDFQSTDEFSIDSSQVVMPVLDKIRFNIKGINSSVPFWFENKLEVFAEGHQIFPRRYCSKCESLSRDKLSNLISKETETDVSEQIESESDPNTLVSFSTNNVLSLRDSEKPSLTTDTTEAYYSTDEQEDTVTSEHEDTVTSDQCSVKQASSDNLSQSKCSTKTRFISKSEMLTIDHDSSSDKITSSSLPDVLTPYENTDKSVQTQVILGVRDFSEPNNTKDVKLPEKNNSHDLSGSVPNPTRKNAVTTQLNNADDVNFIRTAGERFKTFNVNEKLKYWSLIKSARQMMKMNRDVMELNSILKTLSVEKSLDNSNLIGSLSPVNLILKLKSLNRSSSVYNIINEIPDNKETKSRKKQWYQQNNFDYDKCKLSYFNKLSNALAEDELRNKDTTLPDTGHDKLNCPSSDSLLSMETLYTLQKRMLVMMESFLRKDVAEDNNNF